MQITYELTEQDFREALIAHRNRFSINWAVGFTVGFLISFAVVLLVLSRRVDDPRFNALLISIGVLLLVYGLWVAPRWSARKQYRKQPAAHGQKTLSADHSGVHFKGEGTSGDIDWRKLVKWLESKNLFLLYPSPVFFVMVPKRSMAPEQVEEFRSLLRENIKSN